MQFINSFLLSKCLSSAEIRSVFERAGGIIECDGAVDGASEGWAMVSMRSEETATAAIRMFRELRNPIGKDREESWNKQNEGYVLRLIIGEFQHGFYLMFIDEKNSNFAFFNLCNKQGGHFNGSETGNCTVCSVTDRQWKFSGLAL